MPRTSTMRLLRGVYHLLVCVLFLGYSSAGSWAKTFTFDSAADLNLFSVQSDIGPLHGVPEWVANGLGGPGGVRPAGDLAYVYLASTERSFRLSEVGDSISLSAMFYFKNPAQVSNGGGFSEQVFRLGVTSEATFPGGSPTQLSVGLSLNQGTPAQPIATRVEVQGTANGSGNGQGFSIPTLADDRWYRLSATFSIVDDAAKPNKFYFALDDFGATGSAFAANLITNAWNGVLLFGPFKDESAWAGFRMSRYRGAGAEVVDDFTIVPEPLGAGIVAPMALMLTPFVRRRGRQFTR